MSDQRVSRREPRRSIGAAIAAMVIAGTVVVPAVSGTVVRAASIDDVRCVVEPSDLGSQSGVQAVAAGQTLTAATEVDVPAGVVSQSVLTAPDGTSSVTSWIGIEPDADVPLTDLAAVVLEVDGAPQPLLSGTEPSAAGYVLDTTEPMLRVYFPTTTTVVPAGGQTFRLEYVVPAPNRPAGTVLDVATCQAALSDGTANEVSDERGATVALLGLHLVVDKSADLPVLSPSSVVTYTVVVSAPATDASGRLRNGDAFDVVVTDTMPEGLDYVAGSASDAGTEAGGVLTWTIPQIVAGSSTTLTYQLAVPADAGIGDVFENVVTAAGSSQPGLVAGEATYEAEPDTVSLANGAQPPAITKAADVDVAGTAQTITYRVDVTWPAGSTWYDATITDLLPDGITLLGAGAWTCAPLACPPADAMPSLTQSPFVDSGGNTRFGAYVAQVGPFAAPQTWTWTYTGRMEGTYAGGAAVPLGTALPNLAEVRFNLVSRLGGVLPNASRLPTTDGLVAATAAVTFDRPVLTITKSAPTPDDLVPGGLTYTITLTNSGGVAATNATFTDTGPLSASGFSLGTIGSVTGASRTGTTFTLSSPVPANGSAVVTYVVSGAPSANVAVAGDYTNTATLTGYRDQAGNAYPAALPATATIGVEQPQIAVNKERLSASPIAGTDGERIAYRLTLTNSGAATAYNIAGTDTFAFTGHFIPGTCTPGMTFSNTGAIAVTSLAPLAGVSCDYSIELDADAAAGTLTNTAAVTWRNAFGQSSQWTAASGVVPWSATGSAATVVAPPQLAIDKGPEADTPGNLIPNGGVAAYTVTVTNVGAVAVNGTRVTDSLPAGLTLEAAPTVETVPAGIAWTSAGSAGATSFTVDVPTLQPSELFRVTLPVRHDGVEPADDQLVNTASVTAAGIPQPLTDTGVLQWAPAVQVPVALKSATPDNAGIGETVTWTVTASVPANTADLYDVAFVDTLPRGLELIGYGTVTCDAGPLCATHPSPVTLTPAAESTGETRVGWFVGDVGPVAATTTYTFTLTTRVATAYSGAGTPPAGTPLTDTSFTNRVQPWFTVTPARDRYDDGSMPPLAGSLAAAFERRGSIGIGRVHVATPKVVASKTVTNLGPAFTWSNRNGSGTGWIAEPGDSVSYSLTIDNVGAQAAFDVDVTDSMGQAPSGVAMLRDVVVTAPAGVTVTDDWTLADPDVTLHIAELAAGGHLVVTYTGTVAPSADLVPGFSGDNRDLGLIRNTADVDTFATAAGGGGISFADTYSTGADVYVYTPSPYLQGAGCVGGPSAPIDTTAVFSVNARNGAPPPGLPSGTLLTTGYPPDLSVGAGHDATLTVVLTPNIRFNAGTARIGGVVTADPVSTVDASTGRQTLVFDLGTVPQNTTRAVTFQVRTIAAGVQGGMNVSLVMDDASGSPNRGTNVTGAEYAYRHTMARGCVSGPAIGITKYPNLSTNYTGKKQFKVGEAVEWFGAVAGSGAPFHDGVFLDRMPDGIDYTIGAASFTVVRDNGSSVTVSAANGNLTETVTPLPDGRTELRFTSPEFAAFRRMSYSIPSVVATDAVIGASLSNVINLTISDFAGTDCGDPTITVCATGAVQVISSASATVTKSVDHDRGPWGDTFNYTVDVTLPGGIAMYDAYIGDHAPFGRSLTAAGFFAGATITCLAGCGGDVAPSAMPSQRTTSPGNGETYFTWYLGDLAQRVEPRVYRITYSHTFVTAAGYRSAYAAADPPATVTYTNTARTGWNDTNVLADATYRPGTAALARGLATSTSARATSSAPVSLLRPALTVAKSCQALGGRNGAPVATTPEAAGRSFGSETLGSAPNFRCTLTATNSSDPLLGAVVTDPVLIDTLPTTTAVAPARPLTTQLISFVSDQPEVAVAETFVAGSTLTPQQASSLRITAPGAQLVAGQTMTVTVDLRVTASPAFWANSALQTETATNLLAAQSFGDTLGNSYTSTSAQRWQLAIDKPRVTVSERAWVNNGYEQQLADGRPTACMAYALKPEPLFSGRVLDVSGTFNQCSSLKDARGHASSAGGEYARAYAGGAPDVRIGVDQRVTWAVDTAVVNPDQLSAITVTDQIPYGFEYVPGSARLAQWSEAGGTTHVAMPDPVVGTAAGVTCSTRVDFYGGPVINAFSDAQAKYGHDPATPLEWTFARGAAGAGGAFWTDGLSYLHGGNRSAAGALDTATPFDRIVRVVFDVRPTAAFNDCVQAPQRARSFRSRVTATGTAGTSTIASTSVGWIEGVELARVVKGPDAGIAPDGTTEHYTLDVTITDPTRIDLPWGSAAQAAVGVNSRTSGGSCQTGALTTSPVMTPWVGMGDLDRNGLGPLWATSQGTSHVTGFSSALVVTDTILGAYTTGSAQFAMADPWGRPFVGHLASESQEPTTVDGRPATRVTWTFDYYPSPFSVGTGVGVFPCPTDQPIYVTYPSSMRITVPLPIADGTPDGTLFPNTAAVRVDHVDDGALVRTHGDADDALITVRNPLPPPVATKIATPDTIAPGAAFTWTIEAELPADGVWFDLGWTDHLPASMQLVGYGTPTCVLSGTATPCPAPAPTPKTLPAQTHPDGSRTLGWFVGDVRGSAQARTIRMPLTVRFVGDDVAGDVLVNTVTGFSNDLDRVGSPTAPQDPAAFDFAGEPVVGQATVVEPSLAITKEVTSGPGPYQAGSTITYEVTVANSGGAPAYDVVVTDTPAFPLVDVTSPDAERSKGWTAADPSLEWFLSEVQPGQTVTFDVTASVATGYLAQGVREAANLATMSDYTSQPISDPYRRTYDGAQRQAVVPLVAPDLTIEKYADPACADEDPALYAPGADVGWCLVVANEGDATSFNVTVTDVLPPGWTYVADSATVGGSPVEPAMASGDLVWDLGDLAPGAEVRITYVATGPEGTQFFVNTAIADSTLENGQPVPGSPPGFRSRGEAMALAMGAGLQIAKVATTDEAVECDRVDGCSLTWRITIANADELDLTELELVDFLPAGLAYESATTDDGWSPAVAADDGSGAGGTTPITWQRGILPSATVSTFEITAHVPAGGDVRTYRNFAEVSAAGLPELAAEAAASVYATGTIGDRVWDDMDRDGVQDDGEPGLAGVTVELYLEVAETEFVAQALLPIATTATGADGLYSFGDLVPGAYRVRVVAPADRVVSPTGAAAADIDSDVGGDGWTGFVGLSSGQDDLTIDAGLFVPDPDPVPTTTTAPGTTVPPGTTAPPSQQPPGPPTTPPLAPHDPGQLPATGGNTTPLLLWAAVALLLGGGALVAVRVGRRRRTS